MAGVGNYGTGLATNQTTYQMPGAGGMGGLQQTPGINQALAGFQAQQQSSQLQGQENVANIQAQASEYPAKLAMERFQQVFPYLQQQFGAVGQPGAGGAPGGTPPHITAGPVWNPQQIQQQVNTSRAANDASTQSQQRNLQNTLGGQGFGSNSPLAAALGVGLQNQNLQTNTANETGLRNTAAQANASQVLQGQQAQQTQFAQGQQAQLQAAQIQASQRNALLAALAGLN